MKTIYELEQGIVAKKTLDRIKLAFDDVNLEIENLIKSFGRRVPTLKDMGSHLLMILLLPKII